MKIATHNKIFHTDEVTAIALLKVFLDDEIEVERLEHNSKDFNNFDMVIDIGKKFDGIKLFDHHQYKGGKSSAGLIWDYIGKQDKYPKLSKLIKIVDDNDTGVAKAKEFEYSSLIKCYNSHDIYDIELQDKAFNRAVEFAMTIISSYKNAQEELEEAKDIVVNSYIFDNNSSILELERFTQHWTTYINGELTPQIKAVVWKDENDNKYKVKIVPKKLGSFELNAKPLKQDNMMEFVHSSGFFGVAKDEDIMKEYLRDNIK